MLAARSDRDFVAVAPDRRDRRSGAAAGALRVAQLVFTHPRESLAVLILAGASAAITVNALGLQTGRHPAPLFSGARLAPEHPLPPARPAAAAQPAASALPAGAAAPVPPARTAAPALSSTADSVSLARTEGTKSAKATIGDLIRETESATNSTVNAPDAARVAKAQAALTKLGYGALKPDGVMGAGTRQAIERFEKDRKLAVTGELGPRTARELAVQSRMSLD
jgi:Putative peptidoglycan binding domain